MVWIQHMGRFRGVNIIQDAMSQVAQVPRKNLREIWLHDSPTIPESSVPADVLELAVMNVSLLPSTPESRRCSYRNGNACVCLFVHLYRKST